MWKTRLGFLWTRSDKYASWMSTYMNIWNFGCWKSTTSNLSNFLLKFQVQSSIDQELQLYHICHLYVETSIFSSQYVCNRNRVWKAASMWYSSVIRWSIKKNLKGLLLVEQSKKFDCNRAWKAGLLQHEIVMMWNILKIWKSQIWKILKSLSIGHWLHLSLRNSNSSNTKNSKNSSSNRTE